LATSAVAGDYLGLKVGEVDQPLAGQLVHAAYEVGEVALHDEVLAMVLEGLHGRRRPAAHPVLEHRPDALRSGVGVLLGARQRELLLDDLFREHEPRVVVSRLLDVGQRSERVEAGIQRPRQPPPDGVEPHRRGPGDDPDGVHRPDRVPVVDALHVVPHPVGVDLVGARLAGDLQHPAVHVRGHAGEHPGRRLAQPIGPLLPHELVVAADASAGEDHGLGLQREPTDLGARALLAARRRARLEHLARHAGHGPAAHHEPVDAMAKAQFYEPARHGLATRRSKGSTTPGPVPQVT
jgi:hypothetical protein